MNISPSSAGLSRRDTPSWPVPDSVDPPRSHPPWLSGERIAETRRVWSKACGRVISEDEAIEILTNVRRLAEVLLNAEEEKRKS